MRLPSISSFITRRFDVAVLTDIRFPGGSGSSTAQEIRIQNEIGLRTALFHVPSLKIANPPKRDRIRPKNQQPSPKLSACIDSGFANLRPRDAKTYAPLTVIRHPMVANFPNFLPKNLTTDEIVLVINHPAHRAGGLIDYELSHVVNNVRSIYGVIPKLFPISPVIAEACRGPESQKITLDGIWSNIFDLPIARPARRVAGQPMVIGRHSRDAIDKWPSDPEVIRQAYPLEDGIRIKVLGGAEIPAGLLGSLPSNWQVIPFDPFGADAFLRSIDVYVYFHHPEWVEAFGRAPCEAMLVGIPTILPKRFQPTFGDAAIYCEPEDVLVTVRRLQEDPEWYELVANRGREIVSKRFGPSQHVDRLRRFEKIAARLKFNGHDGVAEDRRLWPKQ